MLDEFKNVLDEELGIDDEITPETNLRDDLMIDSLATTQLVLSLEEKYDIKENFSADGDITKNTVDEYLNQLDSIRGRIDSLSNAFDGDPLNDDALSIYPRDQEPDEEPQTEPEE